MILMGRNIAALSGAALAVLVAAPASADIRGPHGGQFILAQDNQELSEEERRRLLREERRRRQEGRQEGRQREQQGEDENAGNAEQNGEGERRRVRREGPREEQQEDSAGNAEQDGDRENRRRVRRDEGEQSEEPQLGEREQRLRERRARQPEQEEGEQGEGQQAQTDERQERLRRLEEERLRALKEAEERRDNVNDRRRRELTDQEQGRRERAKRITEGQDDENRQRRVRRLEAIQGGELSQEERNERRRVRREFTDETLGDVKRARRESREGDRVIIEEPDNRRIIREGRRVRIEEDDSQRMRGSGRNVKTERGPRGLTRTVITRDNGVQVITLRNEDGDIVRRIKRLENGREVVLFNNEPRRKRRPRRDGGDGFSFFIDLPDFSFERSRRDYYLYADVADEEEIYDVLSAEPVEEFEEEYTLEEIRYSPDIHARLRKLNVNTVNFDFGSWEIREDQFDKLEVVARVINRIIERNESEVFLIGGHTDLVGTEEDNLSLAGRRAETVARILTDEFGVPPENLVTQGYGESDPLIDTEEAEAANRRVEFMRITPALAQYEE